MPRKTKEEAEKTRTRILASALSLFTRKGYEHTTFTDIAARLSLTKGAVYWHFKTKEDLLVTLVADALAKFRRQLGEFMPEGELTYPAIAEMMVKSAVQVVSDTKGAAFFRLLKCQVNWSDGSMEKVRDELLNNRFGPKQAFKTALENDIKAGRVKPTISTEEVATVSIALWDGLVQGRIDRFLGCDLEHTLRSSYGAIWEHVAISRTTTKTSKGEKKQ